MIDMHKRNKKIKSDCITKVIVFTLCLIFLCLHMGARDYEYHGIISYQSSNRYIYDKDNYNFFITIADSMDSILSRPFDIYPFRPIYLLIALFGSMIFALLQIDYYRLHKNQMPDVEYGSGGFQTNFSEYNRKFVYDPKLCHPSKMVIILTAPVRFLGRKLGGTTKSYDDKKKEIRINAAPSEVSEECGDNNISFHKIQS